MSTRAVLAVGRLSLAAAVLSLGIGLAQAPQEEPLVRDPQTMKRVTHADRKAAAERVAAARAAEEKGGMGIASKKDKKNGTTVAPQAVPGGTPDYFTCGNWANSPLPVVNPDTGVITGGMRKFFDSLPGLGAAKANNLGQYLSVAVPDGTSFPGSDYYEVGLVEYSQKMHTDLPPTKLRGYVQLNDPANPATKDATGKVIAWPQPRYLGPTIVARRDRPVRIKFINLLPTGTGGDLFIPVDTTVMGAGMGPLGMTPPVGPMNYTQNRGTLHLHGGFTPWISDGTPHQWVTPAGEVTSYPKGVR